MAFERHKMALLTAEFRFNGLNHEMVLFIILARGIMIYDEFVYKLYVILGDKITFCMVSFKWHIRQFPVSAFQ